MALLKRRERQGIPIFPLEVGFLVPLKVGFLVPLEVGLILIYRSYRIVVQSGAPRSIMIEQYMVS
ncbi:MAG: hypothetical protein Q9190_007351 [Brigantiaea leucoxantha]